jgi:pilus assembly protein Flp/PilA
MKKPAFLAKRDQEGPIRQFLGDESGIAVTEYGLLIALVAILLIGVVTLFASQIASWFSAKTSQITSV